MSDQVDFYNTTYGKFQEQVWAEIRREAYGQDIGQSSWITVDEYDRFYSWLAVVPPAHVLEVASGSGGPALYLARKFGCRITGIDINEEGLNAAKQTALASKITNVDFQFADLDQRLPFENDSFDAIMCIDAMNHFRDRLAVLREWHRVLKSGRRFLFTDPVVITGPVSSEELASRSSIGFFLFVPPEVTERFIKEAGFQMIRKEDVTETMALSSERRRAARQKRREDLLKFEGEQNFEGIQSFLATVHKLSSERRLSRFVFVAEK
jgi:SAM-dependent methyltransferase